MTAILFSRSAAPRIWGAVLCYIYVSCLTFVLQTHYTGFFGFVNTFTKNIFVIFELTAQYKML